mmetsp:Transcript_14716/g.42174  ORF Transcript_14716/g.42174 Transcript_14716/m.42174 type:complete len:368 (-) Transcript_14716:282-1385(-)
MWSPPDLGRSKWGSPVREPPPQMSPSPSSASNASRFRFGWPWTGGSGEPSSAGPPEDGGEAGTGSAGSGPAAWRAPSSPRPAESEEETGGESEGDPRTPKAKGSSRTVPTPRTLKSSPPMFSGQNRDAFWAGFTARERSRSRSSAGMSPTAKEAGSPVSPGPRAAAQEEPPPAGPARQPATPASTWTDMGGATPGREGPAQSQPGFRPGSSGSDAEEGKAEGRRRATGGGASPHRKSPAYSAAGSTPAEEKQSARGPGATPASARQTWSSGAPWRAGPAAWTAAGSAKKKAAERPQTAPPKEDDEALSPQALAAELERLRQSGLPERRRYFLAQCLKWHPDKNAGNEARATQMFHVLQEKKDWFLSN